MTVSLLAKRSAPIVLGACCVLMAADDGWAQVVGRDPQAAAQEPLQVVIEREPLLLRAPETYKVPLHLDPIKSVNLAAQVDGIVIKVLGKSGQPVQAQAEVVRLDSRDRQLELDRAKAALEAAKIAQKGAQQGIERELADAQLEVAKIDVELAQYRLDQSTLRAPFDGIVQRVHVVEGQFVRAGEPLATIIDATQLQVEVPIDRNTVKVADQLQIQVENQTASAAVQGVLPLTPPFEPLRDLFESVATGVAVIDNRRAEFQPGQTVYASMIPQLPVTEVPNESIGNTDEGTRRVQVIRNGFVRNVGVELLGAVGNARTFVTGRFAAGDELIVRSSEEMLDGTQVIPRTQLEASSTTTGGGESRGAGAGVPGQTKPGGF